MTRLRSVPRATMHVAAFVLLLVTPAVARAQIKPIDDLAGNITDVGLYAQRGWLKSGSVLSKAGAMNGVGIEVSLKISELTRIKDPILRQLEQEHSRYQALRRADPTYIDSVRTHWKPILTGMPARTDFDATPVERTEKTIRVNGTDTTRIAIRSTLKEKKAEPERETTWIFEAGVAYTQMETLQESYAKPLPKSGVKPDSADVRGGLREFPVLSLYGTCMICSFGFAPQTVRPYLGVRGGISQLYNLRAFSPHLPDTLNTPGYSVFKGDAQTIEAAFVAGISGDVGGPKIHWFFEYAYSWRTFPSVDWSNQANTVVLPTTIPRELGLDTQTFALGFQVHVRDLKSP